MSKLIQTICVLLLLAVLAGRVFVQTAKTSKIPLVEITVYRGGREEAHSFGSKSPVTLKLGGQTYQLKVVSPKRLLPEAEGLLPADAKLTLTSGSSTQTLYSLNDKSESAGWYLLWAGDLDGDGKLDLYLSLDGYNFEERWLFLSSQAGPGRLVKGVAKFHMTGC